MRSRKRTASGEVVVVKEAADPETSNNNGATASSFKKHRRDSCVNAAAGNGSTAENGDKSGIRGGKGDRSDSRVVGSSTSTMALGNSNHAEIDEDLHSRQLAVYGRETMRRLFASNILVSGMQGLGAEIAKNLILAGVKSVTLHDEGAVELWDLSSNFVFSESDVGKNRALASVQKLQELNNAVIISTLTTKLTKEQLSDFQAVVFTDISFEKAIEFNDYCHKHQPPISFIKAEVRGLFGSIFCDFGPEFTVVDVDGEDPHTGIIASISNDNPALVSCVDDERLEFQDGDLVVFSEVHGMTELNDGKPRKIKNAKPYSFTLEEDTTQFGTYIKGGIVTQVKQPKVLNFKPLRDAIKDPGDFLLSDFSKFDRPPLLHLAFQALDKFVSDLGRFPVAGSEGDANKLISIAGNMNESLGDGRLEDINPKLLRQFAFGSRAVLNPMAAMFGGIVGQEVVKACSGKFHPVFQFFYFDSVESLPTEPVDPSDFRPLNSRYDAQISVFGSKLQKKLEKVFVIGGGQIFRESLNAAGCDAIHITEIETNIECDTFMPAIDTAVFQPWYSSFPMVENDIRYCFTTYVRVRTSTIEHLCQNCDLVVDNKPDTGKFEVKKFSFLPKMIFRKHEEYLYLNMIQDIISGGNLKDDRTGTGTLSMFGCQMRFNLRKTFPLLTTKKVFWRGVVEELLWFISGSTNAKVLQEKGIHIWDGNASRDFLDSIGLTSREEGDLGPVYGFQWRHFGARYTDMHADYTGQGFDQLLDVIDKIKNNLNDGRIILSAWNPSDLKLMALPPCHMFAQFYVANEELSCQMYQRSADMGLGVPFNIASYALLTCMIAHVCDLIPGDFIHVLGDTHVYSTHVRPLQEQLQKLPKPFPILKINPEKKNIDSFVASDFKLIGYDPHEKIEMKMAV